MTIASPDLAALTTAELLAARAALTKYSDDEPRDDHGRWTGDGGAEVGDAVRNGDPVLVQPAVRQLRALEAQFPQVPIAQVSIQQAGTGFYRGLEADRGIAVYEPMLSGGRILLNSTYWGNGSSGRMAEMFGENKGFFAVPTAEGQITHEFGHAVDREMNIRAAGNDPSAKAWAEWRQEAAARYYGSEPDVWHHVSGYASTGVFKEALAEGFSLAFSPDVSGLTPAQQACANEVRTALGYAAKAADLRKYSDDEPRDDHGRWTSDGADVPDNGKGHPLTRGGNLAYWGSSHSWSSAITGEAAHLMGIPGYNRDEGPDTKLEGNLASRFLSAIAEDHLGSEEKLYHGWENKDNVQFKPGDTLSLPLLATAGEIDAASYGMHGWGKDANEPWVFEFDKGTPMAGYSRWSNAEQKDFGYIWAEALTAGKFEVTGTRTVTDARLAWWNPPIHVVSLAPVETWHPDGGWQPTHTAILDG